MFSCAMGWEAAPGQPGEQSGLRLLEQFLPGRRGDGSTPWSPSAPLWPSGEAGGFTTVDLLQVDLFTGDGRCSSWGPPPMCERGGTVRRISGTSLPRGWRRRSGAHPTAFPSHLSPGDCVVLVSDGVTGTEDDSWLRERLVKFDQGSPKELAGI